MQDVIRAGNTALITGGAAGIGLAAAKRFATEGMSLVIADVRDEVFDGAERALREAGAAEVLTRKVDVSDRADVDRMAADVRERFDRLDLLMCNAGTQPGSDIFDRSGTWKRVLDVNLWGIINCCQAMVPDMIAGGGPGMVINTGSKQGITTPPGDPAYNVSKAGVKVFTEALAYHFREEGARMTAHLLIPGFVFTDLTRGDRTEKPDGAWTPDETADFMMEHLAAGDFYILCPDNDVSRALDERRMEWAIGDIVENRPPLSRWHKDWSEPFEAFLRRHGL
ncbi:MAG: SDR family NAD(P)-dependent oxidoreductase [Silicimonas sp.]|nr:SDR family NAD(P)-dependent oxidoreductase [Silicimonas sp.]